MKNIFYNFLPFLIFFSFLLITIIYGHGPVNFANAITNTALLDGVQRIKENGIFNLGNFTPIGFINLYIIYFSSFFTNNQYLSIALSHFFVAYIVFLMSFLFIKDIKKDPIFYLTPFIIAFTPYALDPRYLGFVNFYNVISELILFLLFAYLTLSKRNNFLITLIMLILVSIKVTNIIFFIFLIFFLDIKNFIKVTIYFLLIYFIINFIIYENFIDYIYFLKFVSEARAKAPIFFHSFISFSSVVSYGIFIERIIFSKKSFLAFTCIIVFLLYQFQTFHFVSILAFFPLVKYLYQNENSPLKVTFYSYLILFLANFIYLNYVGFHENKTYQYLGHRILLNSKYSDHLVLNPMSFINDVEKLTSIDFSFDSNVTILGSGNFLTLLNKNVKNNQKSYSFYHALSTINERGETFRSIDSTVAAGEYLVVFEKYKNPSPDGMWNNFAYSEFFKANKESMSKYFDIVYNDEYIKIYKKI